MRTFGKRSSRVKLEIRDKTYYRRTHDAFRDKMGIRKRASGLCNTGQALCLCSHQSSLGVDKNDQRSVCRGWTGRKPSEQVGQAGDGRGAGGRRGFWGRRTWRTPSEGCDGSRLCVEKFQLSCSKAPENAWQTLSG